MIRYIFEKNRFYIFYGLLIWFFIYLIGGAVSAHAFDTVGVRWQDDPRLGEGITPWNSPAAAALYCGKGPVRYYAVNDYICSDRDSDTALIDRVYRVLATSTTSTTTLAILAIPRVNNAHTTRTYTTPFQVQHYSDVIGSTGYRTTLNVLQISFTPSCSDNVWNGDETGIDCGGSCDPCQTAQECGPAFEDLTQPEFLQAAGGLLVAFLFLLMIVSAIG